MLLLGIVAALALQDADRVHADADGTITLAGRNAVLREHSDPSKYDVVTEMIVYKGRLLASSCMEFDETSIYQASAYSTEAQILEYSIEKDEWVELREMKESMVFNIRVIDDLLLVPEYFPLNDRSRRIHTFDGKEWGELGLFREHTWHIMDVIKIGETLYASGSWRDVEPEAQKNDPKWFEGYGHVFSSKDGGKTWADLRRTKENGRCLDMVEYEGKLYCNERGYQLICWDGRKWEDVPVRFDKVKVDAKLGSAHLAVFADKILAINADLYYTYNGRTWKSFQPGFIDLWKEGGKLYGLRKDGSVSITQNGVEWTPLTREGPTAKEFDRQAKKGRPLHRGAVCLHRGRLWVGTCGEGKLFAADYESKGAYASKPEKFPAGSKVRLEWETAGAGTVRMKFRTGESQEELAKAVWREPEASPATVPIPRKGGWAQWRAELEGDGKKTPILRATRFVPE
jgi:hypothetical protein